MKFHFCFFADVRSFCCLIIIKYQFIVPVTTEREFLFSKDVRRVFERGQKNCLRFLSVKNTNMPQKKIWSHYLVMTGIILYFAL